MAHRYNNNPCNHSYQRIIQDSLASLAPRVRDALKGIIFRAARVGILAERLFFIAGCTHDETSFPFLRVSHDLKSRVLRDEE
jgi:hypothetical protein